MGSSATENLLVFCFNYLRLGLQVLRGFILKARPFQRFAGFRIVFNMQSCLCHVVAYSLLTVQSRYHLGSGRKTSQGAEVRGRGGEGKGKGVGEEVAGLLTLEIPILLEFGLRFRLDFEVKLRLRLRG
jgi:hypothetical protein